MNSELGSHIIIDQNGEQRALSIAAELQGLRVVNFIEDDFKLEHAKAVIAEAYISEQEIKTIIIATKNFNVISQNTLLKLFEEPPRNIRFILIVPSKSLLLPTIRSRLPLLKKSGSHVSKEIDFDLKKIDNAMVLDFLKVYERVSKHEAKELVEALLHRAVAIDKLVLNQHQLEGFDKAYRLLELNSRPQSVFASLLLSIMGVSDVD
jgi:DNA polymerase-3 subunit delta'